MLENQIFWLFLELVADDDVMLFERPAILKITGHLMVHVHDDEMGWTKVALERKGPGVGEGLLDRFQVRTLLKSNFVSPHTRASLLGLPFAQPRKQLVIPAYGLQSSSGDSSSFRSLRSLQSSESHAFFATLRMLLEMIFLYSDDWNDEAKPRSGMRNVSLTKLDYILLYYPAGA